MARVVKRYDAETGEYKGTFISMADAGRAVNGTREGVNQAVRGKMKVYKGYIWQDGSDDSPVFPGPTRTVRKRPTAETRKKMSLAKLGKKPSQQTRDKMSQSNSSKVRVGSYNKQGQLLEEYESFAEAGRKTGVSRVIICTVCDKPNWTAGGVYWRRLNAK